MRKDLQGKFIVLDGGDGCGKSTQAEMLGEWISGMGVEVVTARDPGGTEIGEKIRDILLDPVHERMGDNVEVMLYMASRGQLWIEKIGPALAAGKCVLLDRWLSSTCAYQGHAGNFGIDNVLKIAADVLDRVWPDLIVILDVDLETAAGRMNRELDRMEQKGKQYHQKVREGFLKFSQCDPRIKVVDASRDIETVNADVKQLVEGL